VGNLSSTKTPFILIDSAYYSRDQQLASIFDCFLSDVSLEMKTRKRKKLKNNKKKKKRKENNFHSLFGFKQLQE
jgi:hypothetical protein